MLQLPRGDTVPPRATACKVLHLINIITLFAAIELSHVLASSCSQHFYHFQMPQWLVNFRNAQPGRPAVSAVPRCKAVRSVGALPETNQHPITVFIMPFATRECGCAWAGGTSVRLLERNAAPCPFRTKLCYEAQFGSVHRLCYSVITHKDS